MMFLLSVTVIEIENSLHSLEDIEIIMWRPVSYIFS